MNTIKESTAVRPGQRHQQSTSTNPAAVEGNHINSAVRLMSETAHDLRSPLTTIREAIRLVHDGDLGKVSDEQVDLLKTAIDQCDCIDQMVGEMTQIERLRVGAPRANRRWISIDEIRSTVEQTLRPWSTPSQVDVLWDANLHAGGSTNPTVYADPSMIRRLIVNLVVNAIRASTKGQEVLIRFSSARNGDFIRCGVIDRGHGIEPSELRQIASQQVSFSGGEGLGMTISRQLAAVHFSSLQIRSRLGYGTEVSFELPAAGPRSVAIAWAGWRDVMNTMPSGAAIRPLIRPKRRDAARTLVGPSPTSTSQAIRLDSPADHVRSTMVKLHHCDTKPRAAACYAAGLVTLGAAVSRQVADQFGDILNRELQMFDMNYRVDVRKWVWAFDADQNSVVDRIESIDRATKGGLEGVRSTWSEPQIIPVAFKNSMPRLSDLMVRQALSASAVGHGLGQDEVRLGTSPIHPSDIANQRLDEELRRLSKQMTAQTQRLKQQSKNLRPRS